MTARRAADYERDAEAARDGLSRTLDELRERLQPSRVADEALEYAKAGGVDVMSGIADAARKSPFSALLVAAGVALFLKDSVKDVGPAASAPSGEDRYTHPAYNADIAPAAGVGTSPDNRSEGQSDMIQKATRIAEEHPLLLAAVGVAVGAAIGAALPRTRAEEELMGDASRRAKRAAADLAGAEYERVKAAASDFVEDVRSDLKAEGLTPDEMANRVKTAAGNAASSAKTHADEVASGIAKDVKTATTNRDRSN